MSYEILTQKLGRVAAEATLYFFAGLLLCFCHYIVFGQAPGFVSRWSGGCAGWTHPLVVANTVGNLVYWWTFDAWAVTILRCHPVTTRTPWAKPTVALMGIATLACGVTHLLGAYTNFNPSYAMATDYLCLTAAVGAVSVFFVAAGLLRVFTQVQRAKDRLEELEAKERSRG